MARPQKAVVDYFPHTVKHGKTMLALESRYGNDGYAFWFKLLELLGETEGHIYDCNNFANVEYMLAKTRIQEVIAYEMLDLLAKLGSIDPELWSKKMIWCDNFIEGIKDAYKRRKIELPQKPSLCMQKPLTEELMYAETPVNEDKCIQDVCENPQSKVNKTKLNKTKKDNNPCVKNLIDFYHDTFFQKFNVKPDVNYAKDGSIIKVLLKNHTEEELQELLKRFFASKDKFILDSGYTIGVFKSQINKLLIEKDQLNLFEGGNANGNDRGNSKESNRPEWERRFYADNPF